MTNITNLLYKGIITFLVHIFISNILNIHSFLQIILSVIMTELLLSNINLNKIIGGTDDPELCVNICKNENNPELCMEYCGQNDYIYRKMEGGENNNDDLFCKKLCKEDTYSINCVDNCKIDLKTL